MLPGRPYLLPDEPLWFPDPHQAARQGLVAVGGDFSVARLLLAYRSGLFPWSVNPITWWSPDPRAIIELDGLHISRSLAKLLRQARFEITLNQSFREVMAGCTKRPGEETWITPEFIEAYTALHHQGHAHSLECRLDGQLAGGIYGLAIGGAFFAESMFHQVSNASKVALAGLVERLKAQGFTLLDIQMLTDITRQMGGRNIPRNSYLARLAAAITQPCRFV